MTTTRQARDELEKAVRQFKAAPSLGEADYFANKMAETATVLLTLLNDQPSRQGSPWRVTYQHTRGPIAGKVFKDSYRSIDAALPVMRTLMSTSARFEISKREDDGSYTPLTAQHLADYWDYPEFSDYNLYGDGEER